MENVAFLFPGQGSQYPGMGKELAEAFPAAAEVFREADSALGFSLSRLCFEGPEAELKLTANTQPAILTVSIAVARVLLDRGLTPSFVAGHSLGEYSAAVSAGALDFTAAVKLVRLRGELMQQAVPEGQGAMAAILGLTPQAAAELCEAASQGEVCSPANFNSPDQIVIAGARAAVERAAAAAADRGGRAVPLPVSAPFHCALMQPAQRKLEPALRATPFGDMRFPLIANVSAEPIRDGNAAREALIQQVVAPVQWERSMRTLIGLGVERFIEVGPGRVLCGLLRRIDRGRKCLGCENPAGIAAAVQFAQGA
jgi:[acyl-carrier-protein] S-malonyltransferase